MITFIRNNNLQLSGTLIKEKSIYFAYKIVSVDFCANSE